MNLNRNPKEGLKRCTKFFPIIVCEVDVSKYGLSQIIPYKLTMCMWGINPWKFTLKENLSISMFPARQENMRIRKDCPVCGDRVNGIHYGIFTCEGWVEEHYSFNFYAAPTVCPGCFEPFYIITQYKYIQWVKTSRTYCMQSTVN